MIVIGASLGGMKVLRLIFRALPLSFPMPVAVVLHRQKDSDDSLLNIFQHDFSLPTHEVIDKEPILPGHLYLAPPDYHLLVEPAHFSLSIEEPVQFARPSIDVLFESAADVFGHRAIGVVLTGANRDGATGAAAIKRHGGCVIVEDPRTAESPIMPGAVLEATEVDHVCPADQIASLLIRLTGAEKPDS